MTFHSLKTRIICVLFAILIELHAATGLAQKQLRAGAFAADITPQANMWPIPLIGGFEDQPATKAHDPLSVRALVLDDGRTKLAIVVIDSCFIAREILDEAKRIASEATGIPSNRMLMSATHTHTAPAATNELYTKYLTDQIAQSVKEAAARLQPVEIGWAMNNVPEELNNRRWYMKQGSIPPNPFGERGDQVMMNPEPGSPDLIRPAGPTDPEVSVVSVRTVRGLPMALLANYSLHYVGNVPDGLVSADYFGEFARQIRDRLVPDHNSPAFVGILSNGTSGDVNNINFKNPEPERAPFEKIRVVAGRVADAVFESYKSIRHRRQLDLAMAEREIKLAVRKPTDKQLRFARAALAAKDENGLPARAKYYAKRAVSLNEGPGEVDVKLQALRIGDLGIVAIPFEVFTEIGLEIKKRSPLRPTFTIELANGAEGYLPTPEQHALGGYETWLGTNRVEIDASQKITETVLDLLRNVSGQMDNRHSKAP